MADSRPIRQHVVIAGYVQGVGFRFAARHQALSLGLHGWIRNTPDGSVEAVVEGRPDAVHSFVDWARSGPSGASVESVETSEELPHGEREFRILS